MQLLEAIIKMQSLTNYILIHAACSAQQKRFFCIKFIKSFFTPNISTLFFRKFQTIFPFITFFLHISRCPRTTEEDVDCDMTEVQMSKDDDTDLESFEREEQRLEEEAAEVTFFHLFRYFIQVINVYCFFAIIATGKGAGELNFISYLKSY